MKQYNIIFDLDGTLWDSSDTIVLAWNDILKKRNMKTIKADVLKSCFGKTFDEIREIVFGNQKNSDLLLQDCMNNEIEFIKKYGGNLYNNTIPTLTKLKNNDNQLFIVSNCQSGYIESFLDFYDLRTIFKDYECEGNTKKDKSHNIRILMKRNNIQNKNTIYIGDTMGDMISSKNNNLSFIYAKYGFGIVTDNECTEINNIDELLLLKKS